MPWTPDGTVEPSLPGPLDGYRAADIVLGSAGHLYEDHEPSIKAFLAGGASTRRRQTRFV